MKDQREQTNIQDNGPSSIINMESSAVDKTQLSPCLEKNPSLEDSQSMPILDAHQQPLKRNGNQSSSASPKRHQKQIETSPTKLANEGPAPAKTTKADDVVRSNNSLKVFPLHSEESCEELKLQGEESKSLDQHRDVDVDRVKLLLSVKNKSNKGSPRNKGDSSSNYDASIFEDEDGDTSSDNMEDSDKDEARRSLGTATPMAGQDQSGLLTHLASGGQMLTQIKTGADDEAQSAKNVPEGGVEDKADDQNAEKSGGGSQLKKLEPMPLIKSGVSIAADLRFGWRPQQKEVHGAPIPLHYDFEPPQIPVDPYTNKVFQIMYLGPRIRTSLDVHKKFANLENLTLDECPETRPKGRNKEEPYRSYTFKFPLKTPYMLPHSFDDLPPFQGMNPKMEGLEEELKFDSMFESGNLDMVIKTKPTTYDLYMRVDTNTRGHHQWFYFSVEVPESMMKKSVTFRVVNFTKPHSLYTCGMRICYSRRSDNYRWLKGGTNIKYGRSHLVRRASQDPTRVIYYSMLTFTFNFEKSHNSKLKDTEKIFFSYCYPYTFTMLQNFLREVSLHQKDSDIYKESILCKSLSGVDVPLLTITSRMQQDPKTYNQIKLSEFEDDDSKLSLPMYKKKKYAIINARVHPGESNSSYMMQGFIKYLLGDSHQAKQLRKRVVFKIVPMINTDGVIIGNYRTGMEGNDLNRRYHKPDFRIHPIVWGIKQLASDLTYGPEEESKREYAKEFPLPLNEEIMAFVDMHGHSRKKNVFIYGPQEPLHSDKYLKMRIIPKLIAEETSKFRYHSCRFRLEQSKLKAARIVMWREYNIMNCFTFEASFHGHFDHENTNYEFTQAAYEEMGEHLCNSLFEYLMIMEEEERRRKLKEIAKKKKKKQKQLAMQRAAQLAKEAVAQQNEQTGKAGQTSAIGMTNGSNTNAGTSQKELGNYLNLPPSGKSGKKIANPTGSSSSRARNVSHVTNKSWDKDTAGTTKRIKKTSTGASNDHPNTINSSSATATRQGTQKEKKKPVMLKSDISSSMRHVISSQDQAREKSASGTKKVVDNPNEPHEQNSFANDSQQRSNIQVGSQDLRQSSNEISRYTNTQLDKYEEELIEQNEQRKRKHGFRNLKDMFAAVREQESTRNKRKEAADTQVDESDGNSECMSEEASEQAPDEQLAAPVYDELDDELTKEQQRKLHGDILNAITQFVKVNNYKEHEYYGVSRQALKKQKKVRANQMAAAILREKELKAPVEVVEEKPVEKKKKQSQKKRQSYQKEGAQAQSSGAVNYQSNTLSVAQKRRSFNIAETAGVPMKQVITNEQLNQQLQYMGGNRLKAGLGSPLYYNLYQSTSNFSNFYVYRFDERGKPLINQQPQLMQPASSMNFEQQHLTQQQLQGAMVYAGEYLNQEGSPKRGGKQTLQQQNQAAAYQAQQQALHQLQQNHQAQQLINAAAIGVGGLQSVPISTPPLQGYHLIQNNETGKIYHLSKNVDGTGNHHLTSSSNPMNNTVQYSVAANSQQSGLRLPVGQYGGAFGSRRSHTKEHMQADHSMKQMVFQSDLTMQQRQQLAQQNVTEFNNQIEQMRNSQQQQAVQPMIFNFFNSKNEVKQRNHHNREQKQSDRNHANQGAYAGVGNNPRSHDAANLHQHHNRTTKFAAASSEARSTKVPSSINSTGQKVKGGGADQGNLLDGGALVGQTVQSQYNQTLLGMAQQPKSSTVTVNERYPVPMHQPPISHTTNNGTFYRQKNGIRSVTNPATNLTASAVGSSSINNNNPAASGQNNISSGMSSAHGKNSGAVPGQKSRSSFNTRKQQSNVLHQVRNEQDVASSNALATNAMTPMTKTQQQTKSAKFANIVAAAEIMKTTSQADQPQNATGNSQSLNTHDRFQTLPKQSLPPHAGAGSNRLIIDALQGAANGHLDNLGSQAETSQQKRLKHSGIRKQAATSTWGANADQMHYQASVNADQPLFENSELKRNAIRQIHPLKTFNQMPNGSSTQAAASRMGQDAPSLMIVSGQTAQAMMSATHDKFTSHPGSGLIQRHIMHHQNNSSKQVGGHPGPSPPIIEIGINKIIPQAPSPTRGIRDRAASYHKAKGTGKHSQPWQLDPAFISETESNDKMINKNFSTQRVPMTSTGHHSQTQAAKNNRLGHQANQPDEYQYQIGTPAISSVNMSSFMQGNAMSATKEMNSTSAAPFAGGQRPQLNQAHSCDETQSADQKKNVVEIRKKLSQLSSNAGQEDKQSSKTKGGSSTVGLKKESQHRLTNDHSSLRRSGDYQTKIHKQISLDPISQQLLMGNTAQSSQEVIAGQATEQPPSSMQASTKPKLGQRVPPDLYQKNPYGQNSQQPSQILTQRLVTSHNQGSKSELRMVEANGQIVDAANMFSTQPNALDSPSRAPQFFNKTGLLTEQGQNSRIMSGADPLGPSQYYDNEVAVKMQMQRTSQVQRSRIISQAQIQDSNYAPSSKDTGNAATTLPLSNKKGLTVTQHTQQQLQNATAGSMQHTPSQGIQHVFADPNYGLIGMHAETAMGQPVIGMSAQAISAAQRHLVHRHYSPRHQHKQQSHAEQMSGTAEPHASRDMKPLWIKNGDSNQIGMQHQSQIMSGADLNNCLLMDPSQVVIAQPSSAQLPNGSVIRIQKSKYQGLIKQRGAPIIVQQSGPTPESSPSYPNNLSVSAHPRKGDGFESPQKMAQMQQVHDLNQQHHSKKLQQEQQLLLEQEQTRIDSISENGRGGKLSSHQKEQQKFAKAASSTVSPKVGDNSHEHAIVAPHEQKVSPMKKRSGTSVNAAAAGQNQNHSSKKQGEGLSIRSGVAGKGPAALASNTSSANKKHLTSSQRAGRGKSGGATSKTNTHRQ